MISARTRSPSADTSRRTGPSPPYFTLFVISSLTSSRMSGRTEGSILPSRSASARRARNRACGFRGSSTLSSVDIGGGGPNPGDFLLLSGEFSSFSARFLPREPRTVRPSAYRGVDFAAPTGGTGLPPLITYEEALALGELEDHAEIEALVDRAFA